MRRRGDQSGCLRHGLWLLLYRHAEGHSGHSGLSAEGVLPDHPGEEDSGAPVSTILDETYKIAITRFDNRIRVGGMAERLSASTPSCCSRVVKRWRWSWAISSHAAVFVEQATFWTGLRPMTPDGTPIVGRTPFKNLWTNTGHGTLGWTMACGSGQLLSDLISGRTPAIPFDDLSAARYQSGFTPSRPQHLHGAHN